jgi:hypothetical protein
MLKRIEAMLFGGRGRRDEHAWGVWQGIEPLIPVRFPGEWEKMSMAGRVVRVYQRARRGTKALVYFGSVLGTQDTWWPYMRPPVKNWVVVQAHLWLPPGTHSEQQVLWVDSYESWVPGDTQMRALRHQRRLEKENLRGEAKRGDAAFPTGEG